MKKEELDFVLFEQQKDFEEEEPLVERELTKKALELINLKLPIIVTGVRRCGKSSLLKIIKNKLSLKNKEYLYINFNDERFIGFSTENFQIITDFIVEQKYKEKCFLFLDEIQEVSGWEKWIDRIKSKYPIFITGSNSRLLSKEISTILTGRSLSIGLTPFNFTEFLLSKNFNLKDWKIDKQKQISILTEFKEYFEIGGFPKRILSGQNIILKELYDQIIYRDIINRFPKSNAKSIKEISVYLLSNPSSLISVRNMSKITGVKNLLTAKAIIDSFENAFLFFFINKFDYSVKKQTQNPRKAYCVDNGFIASLGFRMSDDKGKLLENLVAIELKRREKEIFYYSDKNECDFLIRENNKITQAIQVCYDVNEQNKEREFKGLVDAMNKFDLKEGIILTYTQQEELDFEGKKIKMIPVWKWLLIK
ncbi:MAG: ATP-binding protein [Nanoarchaeota archaeon]